jgi:hypothetical protein
MWTAFLLTAHFPRHGYANGRCSNLGVITLDMVSFVIIRVLGSVTVVVYGSLITVICVVGRIVVMAIYDTFTWFADLQIALLSEYLAWHNGCALGVENLPTRTTVMLTSEGGKSITTAKTGFSILIAHPEFAI